jgi:magnesium chelatase family protein
MLEFPRYVLDGLRQPMEDGRVVLSRAMMSVCYPARFTLIGATNPCPCGRIGDPVGSCSCSPADVERYSRRMSGPLADRIDMHVSVRAVALRDLSSDAVGESSDAVRVRVCAARNRQSERFACLPGVSCNADASGSWIDRNGSIMNQARELLNTAATSLSLSARGFHRVLKVARTIADIDESPVVSCEHVAEALRYRSPAIAQ